MQKSKRMKVTGQNNSNKRLLKRLVINEFIRYMSELNFSKEELLKDIKFNAFIRKSLLNHKEWDISGALDVIVEFERRFGKETMKRLCWKHIIESNIHWDRGFSEKQFSDLFAGLVLETQLILFSFPKEGEPLADCLLDKAGKLRFELTEVAEKVVKNNI